MSTQPYLSVIVNNFNGINKLQVCLSSIQESDYSNFELIVSDCNTPGIKEWLGAYFPSVKLIHSDADIGPAGSRNVGLSLSNCDSKYVVFVDNDTKMHPQWLTSLVEALEGTPDAGAAQPLLLKMDNPAKIDSVGGFFDYIGYACLSKCYKLQTAHVQKQSICYCEAVTIVRRDVLNKFDNPSEPYDSSYFQHWEDVDFCWRTMLLGYKIILVPESIVFHSRGVSAGLGKQTANVVFLNTRNRITTLTKNYGTFNLIRYMPILVFFESLKTTALLRNSNTHALATFKGLLWNLIHLPAIWVKRTEVQLNVRKVEDSNIKKALAKPSLTRLFNDFNRHYGSEVN
jgi:GT2 family glycosyltransferase